MAFGACSSVSKRSVQSEGIIVAELAFDEQLGISERREELRHQKLVSDLEFKIHYKCSMAPPIPSGLSWRAIKCI